MARNLKYEKKEEKYRLQLFKLPIIRNTDDLTDKIHLSKLLLYRLSKYNNKFYKKFYIEKSNGNKREILCPSKEMKAIQAWILRNILERLNISDHATAFIKNKNISDNVKPHVENRFILRLDIDNFFPSIKFPKIYKIFNSIGYNSLISYIFTRFCTCYDKLPQGAVTSPYLANLVCLRMDNRISGYIGKYDITYTRYADDLIFSSLIDAKLIGIKKFVIKILNDEEFKLNSAKTRFMGPCVQRKITGLIINDDNKFGIGKKKKKIIRAKIHKLITSKNSKLKKGKLKSHINGWLSFLNDVDRASYRKLKSYYEELYIRYNHND